MEIIYASGAVMNISGTQAAIVSVGQLCNATTVGSGGRCRRQPGGTTSSAKRAPLQNLR
jgi:hypothetical protein